MKITDNTVFISGGSAGIGLEIARLFSANGNKVIINGRDQQRLDKALQQLNGASAIQGDLSIEEERIRIADKLSKDYPGVNVIINNAGAAYTYSLADSGKAYDYAKDEITTNYLSIIHFTELLLPVLRTKESAVVNVSSILALLPNTGVATYAASKAALHFYTQSLRDSLSDTQVHVFELLPPLVNTEFSAAIGGANGITPQEVAEELLAAFETNQFDVPVGQTKVVHQVFQQAIGNLRK
jgi:uncharacterized oxidoreductase